MYRGLTNYFNACLHSVSKEAHCGKLHFFWRLVYIDKFCIKIGIKYHAFLAKRNTPFGENTEFALIAMGFEQFYELQTLHTLALFKISREQFDSLMGFFVTCFL